MPRTLLSDDRGSVTLEYAIWFPVFFAFLITVVEVSLILFSHARMWDVARDYGRRVAVGEIAPRDAETAAKASLQGLLDYEVAVNDTGLPGQVIVNIVAANPNIFLGVYSLFSPEGELRTIYTIRDER